MTDDGQSRSEPEGPFDSTIQDRLAAGELGVVAARPGVGKTACIIQFALAELMRGRLALHVAVDMTVAQVRSRYDRLFSEAGRLGLVEASDPVRMEMERRRHIQSYPQQGFGPGRLTEVLAFLHHEMDFQPRIVVVDGYPFEKAGLVDLERLAEAAAAGGVPVWMTAVVGRNAPIDESLGLPDPLAPLASALSVVVQLRPHERRVRLCVLKDHGSRVERNLPVHLDPASLLLLPS